MRRLVHLVSDCGPGELRFAGLVQALGLAAGEADVVATVVGRDDTLAAGWCVAELALADGPPGRVVVHHVGEGERLCFGRSRTGALVIGPDSGWTWSFVAGGLSELCRLDVGSGGFEVLPVAVRHAIMGHSHAIDRLVPRDQVPAVPDCVVAWIERGGNIKTTVSSPPAAAHEEVLVRLAGLAATATVTDGSFVVDDGDLALAPCVVGGQRRFFELLQPGGSAAEQFGRPPTGTHIALEPAG